MNKLKLIPVFALIFILSSCGDTPEKKAERVNAIQQQITPAVPIVPPSANAPTAPASASLIDGVAVLILVDISGSMDSSVKNSANQNERKLDIAKRRVLDIVKQTEAYALQHPDRKIVLEVSTFSSERTYRAVVPVAPPSVKIAEPLVNAIVIEGGTAIGDAMIAAKKDLDSSNMARMHIITITDGENGGGADPADVAAAFAKLASPPALYLIGFDVNASVFDGVKKAGSLVLSAQNEAELQKTLDFVLGSKILVEKPE